MRKLAKSAEASCASTVLPSAGCPTSGAVIGASARRTRQTLGGAVFGILASVALVVPCDAENLREALKSAYETSPTLASQRDQQRALDETYVQAKSGWRATAGALVQGQYEREPNSVTQLSAGSSAGSYGYGALNLTQPIYTGGRILWAVRAAEAAVAAGRQDLRAVEAQVFYAVIKSYLDVLRDQEVLKVRQSDMATLEREAGEAKAKFDLGQVTRTDVAQAQAQLESARAALAEATGQLDISRAEYVAAVGHPPDKLTDTAVLPGLPASIGEALDLAEAGNPLLLQSKEQARSSKALIAAAKAGYRPTVSLQGSFGYIGPVAPLNFRDYGQDVTGGVILSVPILTGGVVKSQVRQATAKNGSDEMMIEATRREIIQNVAQAWSQLESNRLAAKAAKAQVDAADLALRGNQSEYAYGLRTTLDVLIADQNLRAAQSSLAVSRHDALLAEAFVLDVVGRLEAANLLPQETPYDPRTNFDRVKNAGGFPWDGAVKALDAFGAPSP